jgi:hypothetical protein
MLKCLQVITVTVLRRLVGGICHLTPANEKQYVSCMRVMPRGFIDFLFNLVAFLGYSFHSIIVVQFVKEDQGNECHINRAQALS